MRSTKAGRSDVGVGWAEDGMETSASRACCEMLGEKEVIFIGTRNGQVGWTGGDVDEGLRVMETSVDPSLGRSSTCLLPVFVVVVVVVFLWREAGVWGKTSEASCSTTFMD